MYYQLVAEVTSAASEYSSACVHTAVFSCQRVHAKENIAPVVLSGEIQIDRISVFREVNFRQDVGTRTNEIENVAFLHRNVMTGH